MLRLAVLVSLGVFGSGAGGEAQNPGQARLSLHEASAGAEARSCTLEVLLNETGGEATLTCERTTPPVSHLGAHRALTASEAARLYTLASATASPRPPRSESPAPASGGGAKVVVTIERSNQRVVLDASGGSGTLSGNDQRIVRLLREIADGLRGAGRR